MPEIFNKLSSYAALIGVIGAIGGGVMAWGEFNNRIEQLENVSYEATDLSGIQNDISQLNEKINDDVNDLDRTLQELIDDLYAKLGATKSDVAINSAAIEYLDAKIEELMEGGISPQRIKVRRIS